MRSAFVICLFGLALVLFLFWLIRILLAPRRSFSDFFVGDTGGYSISRVQAVFWAIIIISYQVSAFTAAIALNQMDKFTLVFSPDIMWLLGLSLGSYVVVKGITANQINTGKIDPNRFGAKRSISELVMSDEGLDFSRFQMLIWTLFSMIVFISSYYHYIDSMLHDSDISNYFKPFSDPNHILPTIDMSLIVLMGLSQGAYIGRKLIPANRVEEVTREFVQDIETREYGLSFQESELKLMLLNPEIAIEKKMEIQLRLNEILNKKKILEIQKAEAITSLAKN